MKKFLSETHKELTKQWYSEKNLPLKPNEVVAGSGKKVWWKCNKGDDHIWQAVINHRTMRNHGCPYCSGRFATSKNNLLVTHPELCKEWNCDRNTKIKPEQVKAGSERKVWWKCKKGHEWKTQVNIRTKGHSCPVCKGFVAGDDNNIKILYPKISSEWDYEKNAPLVPENFLHGSDKAVWWKCKKGHEWKIQIKKRTLRKQNCPICNNQVVNAEYNLKLLYPNISKQWHPTKNRNKKPENFMPNSNMKVWWKCDKGKDHEWIVSICNRVSGTGCPICANYIVKQSNSLQETHPELAKEWHPTKNKELTPSQVAAGSNKKVWWKCEKGDDHVWLAKLSDRKKGLKCPICRGLKVVHSNSLKTLYPEIAKEWNYKKNKSTPSEVVPGSHLRVWWMCKNNPEHEWQASLKNRTRGNQGCPFCRIGSQSKQELTLLFELKFFFPSIPANGYYIKHNKKRYSIDIYIPELNIGIEFDGSFWHKERLKNDKIKNYVCNLSGIDIIRIREKPLKEISENDILSEIIFNPKTIMNDIINKLAELRKYRIKTEVMRELFAYTKHKNLINNIEMENYLIKHFKVKENFHKQLKLF